LTRSRILIRRAQKGDASLLNSALRALSRHHGDTHRAGDEDIAEAGFGPNRSFVGVLGETDGRLAGAAIFSPLYSTIRGCAGLYVSDLWVAEDCRGAGLGRRLLATAAKVAAAEWGAGFLRLSVRAGNDPARAFYARLGFSPDDQDTYLTLEGSAFAALEPDA